MNGAVNVLKVHYPRATSDKPTLYVQKKSSFIGLPKKRETSLFHLQFFNPWDQSNRLQHIKISHYQFINE